MNEGFLVRLMQRTRGETATVRPRARYRFEPAAGGGLAEEVEWAAADEVGGLPSGITARPGALRSRSEIAPAPTVDTPGPLGDEVAITPGPGLARDATAPAAQVTAAAAAGQAAAVRTAARGEAGAAAVAIRRAADRVAPAVVDPPPRATPLAETASEAATAASGVEGGTGPPGAVSMRGDVVVPPAGAAVAPEVSAPWEVAERVDGPMVRPVVEPGTSVEAGPGQGLGTEGRTGDTAAVGRVERVPDRGGESDGEPDRDRRARPSPAPRPLTVTIGRIEVVRPQPDPPPRTLGLDDYLGRPR